MYVTYLININYAPLQPLNCVFVSEREAGLIEAGSNNLIQL
jgi:hypothetical protein